MSSQRCHSLSSFTDSLHRAEQVVEVWSTLGVIKQTEVFGISGLNLQEGRQDSQTESQIDGLEHSPGAPGLLVG